MAIGIPATKNLAVEKTPKSWTVQVGCLLRRWSTYCLLLHSIHSERRALSRLTDNELRDVGISRSDARSESARGILSVPNNR